MFTLVFIFKCTCMNVGWGEVTLTISICHLFVATKKWICFCEQVYFDDRGRKRQRDFIIQVHVGISTKLPDVYKSIGEIRNFSLKVPD